MVVILVGALTGHYAAHVAFMVVWIAVETLAESSVTHVTLVVKVGVGAYAQGLAAELTLVGFTLGAYAYGSRA